MEQLVLDSAQSSLAQRIAAAPRAAADDAEGLDAWLTEISGTPASAALRQIFADHPSVSALVAGLAEFSPYLLELVRRDPGSFVTLLESAPDLPRAAVLGEGARAVGGREGGGTGMGLLRRMKPEGAVLVAVADIGGVWPVMRITAALTEVANAAVSAAVRYLFAE